MIKDNEYELYELVLKDEEDSVFALSLVSEPAIMQDFIFFNAEGKQVIKFATANEDKHLIVGPILIPDIKILRLKEDGVTPYYVTFTKETVEKIAQKYIKDNNANNITLEHLESVNNVSLVESWIVESSVYDKSKAYGLTVKPGTWMGVFSLENNKDLWNDYVKTGLVKGISLEGLFTHELIKASKVKFDIFEKDIEELTEDEANIVLSKIKQMFESYADYGEGIRNNAKKGIELNEKNNNKCATQTGKVRAQQLANGEAISLETIKRMYSYLSRAETYYDETDMNACGTISYLLWGGKAALAWSRNKLKELGVLEEAEQPSITSSYPGEAADDKKKYKGGDVPPILQDFATCPEATQNIKLNIENRQKAIDEANYGPINPNEPNEDYWKAKADQFKGNIEEAKKALCGNCAFFYRTPQILKCIADGLGEEVDPYEAIKAGEIGYCDAFDFKCAANRTCSAWVGGGPITE
jgi:hypothetical protein